MAKSYKTPSGDFLAFVDDLKRKETKPLKIGERTFYVRGPALMTDAEVLSLNDEGTSIVDKARCVIDDYDGFAAAGGTAMLLMKWYDAAFDSSAEGEDEAS